MASKLLTKSRFMNGAQCLKLLWLSVHAPESIPQPDAASQRVLDQGHLVGELARKLFPQGIQIPQSDFMGNIRATRSLLKENQPLFEAGFMAGTLFSRVDILRPSGEGAWDIIEVKSVTSVKDEHLQDIAFQKYCLGKAGLPVNRCYLAHLNNQYIRHGEIEPDKLFRLADVSEEVVEAGRGIEEKTEEMSRVLALTECPEGKVGPWCSEPYACRVNVCFEELPANNILTLYRGGKKRFEWLDRGVLFIKDIPAEAKLSAGQEKQKWCDIHGEPFADSAALKEFLAELNPPLQFLDFETFATAVPLIEGTRPFQRIPFQYSLQRLGASGTVDFNFLSEGKGDPRPGFLRRLREDLAPEGSIITYNQAFEEGVLKELAEAFPEYSEWVDGVRSRLRDLYRPFRNLDYYHPGQGGSTSIKEVLPALTGNDYASLAIQGGDEASAIYLRMTYEDLSREERARIRTDLLKYCGLETQAMIWILDKLREVCR